MLLENFAVLLIVITQNDSKKRTENYKHRWKQWNVSVIISRNLNEPVNVELSLVFSSLSSISWSTLAHKHTCTLGLEHQHMDIWSRLWLACVQKEANEIKGGTQKRWQVARRGWWVAAGRWSATPILHK